MRKVVAVSVAAAALAWAQSVPADHHMKRESGAAASDRKSAERQQQEPGSQSAVTAQRTNREERTERQGVFEGKDNFDVDGRVSQASASEVTIEREELPAAKLKIGPSTKVEVDGEKASAAQLKPGQEVKASFNLRGGTAEAVELKAKKAEAEDRQKLNEQRQETREEMREKQQERQQQRRQ